MQSSRSKGSVISLFPDSDNETAHLTDKSKKRPITASLCLQNKKLAISLINYSDLLQIISKQLTDLDESPFVKSYYRAIMLQPHPSMVLEQLRNCDLIISCPPSFVLPAFDILITKPDNRQFLIVDECEDISFLANDIRKANLAIYSLEKLIASLFPGTLRRKELFHISIGFIPKGKTNFINKSSAFYNSLRQIVEPPSIFEGDLLLKMWTYNVGTRDLSTTQHKFVGYLKSCKKHLTLEFFQSDQRTDPVEVDMCSAGNNIANFFRSESLSELVEDSLVKLLDGYGVTLPYNEGV